MSAASKVYLQLRLDRMRIKVFIALLVGCWIANGQTFIGRPLPPLIAGSSLTNDLIGYYRIDTTTYGLDTSGNGRNLALNNAGGMSQVAAVVTNGVNFANGFSSYLTYALTGFSLGTNSMTFAGWGYLSSKATKRCLASKWGNATNNQEWRLDYDNNADKFTFTLQNSGTSVTVTNSTSPALNTFYFVAATYDTAANSITLSVNGDAPATATYSLGGIAGNQVFAIGNANGSSFWVGRVDECAFWLRALSSDEVTTIYNSGAGRSCCPFNPSP